MQVVKNFVFHERAKHIEIDCHFTRHHFHLGTISLPCVPSALQIVDTFMNAQLTFHFHLLSNKLSMLIKVL